MARSSATLLFAGIALAQATNYTTTAWMTNFAGTDKYGYVASVIDADAEHITLSMDFDSGTNATVLNIGGPGGNYTFGKTAFTISTDMDRFVATPTDGDMGYQIACTQPAEADPSVTCNVKIGDGYARAGWCNEYQATQTFQGKNITSTITHTYGTGIWGPAGTETITQKFEYPLDTVTTTPTWCTSDEVPETVLERPYPTSATDFAVYQIVIYAGQEKLSAHSSPSVDVSTIGPGPSATTASGSSGAASTSASASRPPQSIGAAGKMSVAVSALAGMGVAAVMCVL
ncbi:hypothetical protein E8E12_009072 [Didymella heteroderae]|uniref:Uncharacterized protein n=1 Tax=Didymella heteroderae TaxID=1769908 RepID=A0A9P5C2X0_9PLEO|nr:hypothetical protein E8E12_009072 [Didymella heteroderae]